MSARYGHLGVLTAEFERRYGGPPVLAARAPGRVNLIGEHTDYNGGWVLPAAISFEVDVVSRPRDDGLVRLTALDLGQEATFDLRDRRPPAALWLRYPQGVAVALQEAGHELKGMDAVYCGDVPIGAGLSSSAAVEVAFAAAYATASGPPLSGPDLALPAHRAENEFVGVPCGIMDQFISALARKDEALLLHCATLDYRYIPIRLPGISIVVMDSGVRRELASSEYGRRRADCEAAVERLRSRIPNLRWLTALSPEGLEANADLLDELLLRRARHVVQENWRTLEAAQALEAGDARRFGALMRASHESLRDLYEVSSPELDRLVEIAWSIDGVVGARMTGAGFGGAAVALVEQRAIRSLEKALNARYPLATGKRPGVYICAAAGGAEATWLT